MRMIKTLALVVVAAVIFAGAILTYLAASFDPDSYRQHIVDWVKTSHQRTLKLDGKIRLTFWPNVGVDLGAASLSEYRSDKVFASFGRLRVSMKVLPLLSKRIIVDQVLLGNASVNVVRGKDGRLNIADLLEVQGDSTGSDFRFAVSRVAIDGLTLRYRDEGSGTAWTASDVRIAADGIAPGSPAGVKVSMKLASPAAKAALAFDGESTVILDKARGQLVLGALKFNIAGEAAGFTNLKLRLAGGGSIPLGGGLPSAEQLDQNVEAQQESASIFGHLALKNLKADGYQASGSAAAEMSLKDGQRSANGRLASLLGVDIRESRLRMTDIKTEFELSDPKMPGKRLQARLQGMAAADFIRSRHEVQLNGTVDGKALRASVRHAGSGKPLEFDVDAESLDIDALMPASASPGPAPAGDKSRAGSAVVEKPLDLSGLRPLHVDGRVRLGRLKVNRVTLTDVSASLRAAGGVLIADRVSAASYDGKLQASGRLNASGAMPGLSIRQRIDGVALGPFLKDLAANDRLEGRATISADVSAAWHTVSAMKRALNGQASVRVANGLIRGIDIAGALRKAKDWNDRARGGYSQTVDRQEKTDFSELSASFAIAAGIAQNRDLSMKSPLLRVGGEGQIDIAAATLNYLVKASVVATAKGQGGRDLSSLQGITLPIRLTGSLADPAYAVDFNALVTDTARRKVEDAITRRLKDAGKSGAQGRQGGGLEGALKGLFGR